MKIIKPLGLLMAILLLQPISLWGGTDWNVLSDSEKQVLERILDHWQTWVPERKSSGTAVMMTFEELYDGLGEEESGFLDRLRAIDPKRQFNFQGDFLGSDTEEVRFKRVENQWIERNGERTLLYPQYVPEPVYLAFEKMMRAMEKKIGKRLFIESGFRSSAYQLYTYVYYINNHAYSLVETGHWVALPGYSEHGQPSVQALDLINEQGINGDDDGQSVEDFESLPEYAWLMEHGSEYGFVLSYPRDKPGITFEPWHWSYRGPAALGGGRT
ncbi:MAG: D-alanyl-D-alanine carboxypeptidase family protein [Candidatus Omnitrophica bacterium]|nr:D-alanyl-D-alanine carboxypeptidase family protein [Candidatus Omnitrophota bacterium]